MLTVGVTLLGRAYQVHVDSGLLGDASLLPMPPGSQAVIVADAQVQKLHAAKLQQALAAAKVSCETVAVAPGEQSKSWASAQMLCDFFARCGLDRDGWIVALGGGMICDLAGFAAGIYLRGISCVSAPTTLLAQVDASVGGKTGINLAAGKNLVGIFHHPALVLADVAVLGSMPQREYRSGLAEVVKHGLLSRDILAMVQDHASELARGPDADRAVLRDLVAANVRFKAEVVAADERESGIRAHLNLGHTFAHAIEAVQNYRGLLHGEAVAVGLVAACRLAAKLGVADAQQADEVAGLLQRLGLPCTAPGISADALLRAMARDKKVRAKQLRFVLPVQSGGVMIKSDVPDEPLRQVLAEICTAHD